MALAEALLKDMKIRFRPMIPMVIILKYVRNVVSYSSLRTQKSVGLRRKDFRFLRDVSIVVMKERN